MPVSTKTVVVAMFGMCLALPCCAVNAQTVSKTQMLADFEDGKLGIFAGPGKDQITATGHMTGKSVLIKGGKQQVVVGKNKIDWLAFDFLRFEVYNPGTAPARLSIVFIDDSRPHGYYSYINRLVSVRSGLSTVELNIKSLRRGEGSVKDSTDPRPFHWDAMTSFSIAPIDGDVELDNIRLEKVDFPSVEGVKAFDFGPAGSPAILGMTGVTPETVYNDQTGYGWSRKGNLTAKARGRGADTLVGDWISGIGSTFTVNLPDGKYRVWMLWHDAGEWEFYQNFTNRSIKANGKVVVEEKMDGKEFLDRYFHFAEQEDMPGDDIHSRYVDWYWQPKEFDVEVTGGKLDLTLDGSGPYAATVNGLVIYPAAKEKEAKSFIEAINGWRKHEFASLWAERMPAKTPLDPQLAGSAGDRKFIVFRRAPKTDSDIFEAPVAAEIVDPKSAEISITAARDSNDLVALSVHALENLGDVRMVVGELKADGGKTLPKDCVTVQQVRNKFRCIGFSGGGMYGSVPWLAVDGAKSSIPKDANRTYYVTVHVPKDQAGGLYQGKLTIQAGGKELAANLSVRVLPMPLPEADMGMTMFSMGKATPSVSYYPDTQARLLADQQRSMAYAREVGFNQITVDGVKFVSFKGGQPVFDLSQAIRNVGDARKAGFPIIYLSCTGSIFATTLRDRGDAASIGGFDSAESMVKALFGGAIKACKDANLPEPFWNFGDEPAETQAANYVSLHSRLREVANGKTYISWSTGGENQKRMLDVTSFCSLNTTTAEDIKRAQAAGNVVWLNNQGLNRWAFGLYAWKAHQLGVQAIIQFTWSGPMVDPYYPLDGIEDDWSVMVPDREGVVRSTAELVRIHQGVNDYRYTLALKQAIEKASAAQKPLAAEAGRFLEDTFAKIKLEKTTTDRVPQMSEKELNEYRDKVQDYLLKLTQP